MNEFNHKINIKKLPFQKAFWAFKSSFSIKDDYIKGTT